MKAQFKQIIPVLRVPDLAAAMQFYTEKLGFSVSFTSEWEYNGVARDGIELHLGKGERNPAGPPGADLYFMVDNVGALREEFVRSGAVTAEAQMIDQPYGMLELHLADPFGNRLGFAEATAR